MPVSFLVKLQALSLQLYFKMRLWHRCFPVNFLQNKSNFFTEHLRWLLLLINNVSKIGDWDAGFASGMTLFVFYRVTHFSQNIADCSYYCIQQMECIF